MFMLRSWDLIQVFKLWIIGQLKLRSTTRNYKSIKLLKQMEILTYMYVSLTCNTSSFGDGRWSDCRDDSSFVKVVRSDGSKHIYREEDTGVTIELCWHSSHWMGETRELDQSPAKSICLDGRRQLLPLPVREENSNIQLIDQEQKGNVYLHIVKRKITWYMPLEV